MHTVVAAIRNLAARFVEQFGEPVQVLPVDPQIVWQQVEFDTDVEQQLERLCAAERAAVCDLANQPTFRAALITMPGNRHRLVR